jgi:7-cyano-7-deazaguanine reductase
MTTIIGSPLGKPTEYPDRYTPSLLFSFPRSEQRQQLGVGEDIPFTGADLWTAYEISWLDARGKPQLAVGEFVVPADSPSIVESKSVKLYLGSFAQEPLKSVDALTRRIADDLKRACGTEVGVVLTPAPGFGRLAVVELPGESIDASDTVFGGYTLSPGELRASGPEVTETLRSALFRVNCPVTGQPDHADVMLRYRGPRIDRAGLLRYVVSYRKQAAFHESCVERIFVDVLNRCRPRALTVYARFLRRGGIDINPFRSNFERAPPRAVRTPRQ